MDSSSLSDLAPRSHDGPAAERVGDSPRDDGGAGRRADILTASLGIAYAVLFLISFELLSGTPGPQASDSELVDFYTRAERRRLVLAGSYLMPFAGVAFVWFMVAIRMWISQRSRIDNVLLSNIQLISGSIFVALWFAASATASTTAVGVEFAGSTVEPLIARQFPLYGNTLMFGFALRMAAMFVFTTSTIGRSARILPVWFTLAGYGVGLVLLLSATFDPLLARLFAVWMLVLSALLLLRAAHSRARGIPESR
jgi:hypothetical protein